jgi:hypothetical protein
VQYILITVALFATLATFVFAAAILSEPSFETITNWVYTETDADYNDGTLSTAWTTQGTYSYLLSATSMNISNGKHSEATQTVYFTSIDTLSFNARLFVNASNKCEARVLVGSTTVWSQVLPTTETSYLHQEVDLSGYTGSQNLVFQTFATATHNGATLRVYYDNIKLWGSYSNSGRTTISNTFSTLGNSVYMYGENFDTTGTYKIAYYDGGTLHDGADGTKLETDTFTDDADGILDQALIAPSDYPDASYGTWHAVVYKTTGTMPTSYDLVSTDDAAYTVTDTFTVNAPAIPEFPAPIAAVTVVGTCFGIYYWMRKGRPARVRT